MTFSAFIPPFAAEVSIFHAVFKYFILLIAIPALAVSDKRVPVQKVRAVVAIKIPTSLAIATFLSLQFQKPLSPSISS